ncbi:MAG: CinA family protein [Pseudomonadota bacterium]|nr:CinA family protein [Pseudomonadota bacterium]
MNKEQHPLKRIASSAKQPASFQRDELIQKLAAILIERRWQVSTAESCTGGGVSFSLTSIAGSSAWFERSFVTYSNQAKVELLGVKAETLAAVGAVSQEVAEQMACGARAVAQADIAVSVTGIAGPGGGSEQKPVGTVWFGLAHPEFTLTDRKCFAGDRQAVREQSIDHAISLLLKACSHQ